MNILGTLFVLTSECLCMRPLYCIFYTYNIVLHWEQYWSDWLKCLFCSLMYGAEDPSIAGMVLDSPFSDLVDLMTELVDTYKIRLPKFTVRFYSWNILIWCSLKFTMFFLGLFSNFLFATKGVWPSFLLSPNLLLFLSVLLPC